MEVLKIIKQYSLMFFALTKSKMNSLQSKYLFILIADLSFIFDSTAIVNPFPYKKELYFDI